MYEVCAYLFNQTSIKQKAILFYPKGFIPFGGVLNGIEFFRI